MSAEGVTLKISVRQRLNISGYLSGKRTEQPIGVVLPLHNLEKEEQNVSTI